MEVRDLSLEYFSFERDNMKRAIEFFRACGTTILKTKSRPKTMQNLSHRRSHIMLSWYHFCGYDKFLKGVGCHKTRLWCFSEGFLEENVVWFWKTRTRHSISWISICSFINFRTTEAGMHVNSYFQLWRSTFCTDWAEIYLVRV